MTFKLFEVLEGELKEKQNTVLDYYVTMGQLPKSDLKAYYYNGTLVHDVTGKIYQ